jgi:hypothetical protein
MCPLARIAERAEIGLLTRALSDAAPNRSARHWPTFAVSFEAHIVKVANAAVHPGESATGGINHLAD